MKKTHSRIITAAISVFAVVLLPASASFAATDTEDTAVNANIGSVIAINVSGSQVDLATVTPTGPSSSASTAQSVVNVSTNNATGYVLSLQMATGSSSNNLISDSNVIGPTTGGAVMTANSWGYSLDSTSINQSDVALSTINGTWNPVPATTGSPAVLKTTATNASNDTTNVIYGMNANSSQSSGGYTGTVTYTATTN